MPGVLTSPPGPVHTARLVSEVDDTAGLLQEWCQGDRQALARLIGRNADWIKARIRRRRGAVMDHVETMDQFQELMLGMLEFAPRFVVKGRGQLRALLGRMIENDLVDRARAEKRRRDFEQQGLNESCLSLDPSVPQPQRASDAAVHNEELAWARLALEFLDDDDRHLVERHVFGGRTFRELEAEFGMSQNALRMRYNRCVVRLTGIIQKLQRGEIEQLDAE